MTRKQKIVALRELIRSPEVRATLVGEADSGRVPVAALREILLVKFGEDFAPDHSMKQFVGKLILSVLSEEGFVIAKKHNRVEDGMFERGTTYQRANLRAEPGEIESFFRRFIASLTPAERRVFSELLL